MQSLAPAPLCAVWPQTAASRLCTSVSASVERDWSSASTSKGWVGLHGICQGSEESVEITANITGA